MTFDQLDVEIKMDWISWIEMNLIEDLTHWGKRTWVGNKTAKVPNKKLYDKTTFIVIGTRKTINTISLFTFK